MKKHIIIALGGSLVNPSFIDTDFISQFYTCLLPFFNSIHFSLVVGGGNSARIYQKSYTHITQILNIHSNIHANTSQDAIGIMATRLNAQLLKEIFHDYAEDTIVTDPTANNITHTKPILIAAGWKPGFSTDYITIKLAQRFSASKIINLTNIEKIYTDDPKKNSHAQPLDTISWQELLRITETTWTPGLNTPFDPIAAQHAQKLNLEVISAYGKNIDNLRNILSDKPFIGTKIY